MRKLVPVLAVIALCAGCGAAGKGKIVVRLSDGVPLDVTPGRRAGAGRLERDLQRTGRVVPELAGRSGVLRRRQGLPGHLERDVRRVRPHAPGHGRAVHRARSGVGRAQLAHPPGHDDERLLRNRGVGRDQREQHAGAEGLSPESSTSATMAAAASADTTCLAILS